jgi:hypothetical protein
MLITDLLEDLYRMGKTEIEFHHIDKDGNSKKLELFITDGKYLYKHKDKDGNDTDIIILGLEKPDA